MKTEDQLNLKELEQCGVLFIYLTPYQIRFENELDIWFKKHSWHHIPTNKRGKFKDVIPFIRDFVTTGKLSYHPFGVNKNDY